MQRKITKLLHKYQYLKCEKEELVEIRDKYSKKLASKIDTQQDKNQEGDTTQKIEHLPEVKRLYRQLSKYIHPDKGGDSETFSKIVEYYNTNNYIELLYLAYQYSIPTNPNIRLIENEVNRITREIDLIKKSAPYVWGNLPDEKKEQFEDWLIHNYKFKRK